MKLTENSLYGVRKGISFYFYDNPDIEKIKELIEDFRKICNPEFLYYSYMNAEFHLIKNKDKWYELMVKKLEKSDYRDTVTLVLTDSTKVHLQNNMIEFRLLDSTDDIP